MTDFACVTHNDFPTVFTPDGLWPILKTDGDH
jgi:hypothetical protein